MLTPANSYEEVYASFRWHIPEYCNIGVDICDKQIAEKDNPALIYETEAGRVNRYTFGDLIKLSNPFANVLTAAVIGVPDPVRTEIVKAFIVPKNDIDVNDTLKDNIKNFVRHRLAAHEYPREIAFCVGPAHDGHGEDHPE